MAHLKKRNGHLVHTNVIGGLGDPRHLVKACITEPPFPNCCAGGAVISATLSGATGCAIGLNATFSLSLLSSCVYSYDSGILTPVDPCGTPCYTDVGPFGWTRYWQPTRYAVTVTLSNTTQSVEVLAVVNYTLYRDVGSGCEINASDNFPTKGAASTFRRATCQFGTLIRDGGAPSGIPSGLPPSDCTIDF